MKKFKLILLPAKFICILIICNITLANANELNEPSLYGVWCHLYHSEYRICEDSVDIQNRFIRFHGKERQYYRIKKHNSFFSDKLDEVVMKTKDYEITVRKRGEYEELIYLKWRSTRVEGSSGTKLLVPYSVVNDKGRHGYYIGKYEHLFR